MKYSFYIDTLDNGALMPRIQINNDCVPIFANIVETSFYEADDPSLEDIIDDLTFICSQISDKVLLDENGYLYGGQYGIEYDNATSTKPFISWDSECTGMIKAYRNVTEVYQYISLEKSFDYQLVGNLKSDELLRLLEDWKLFLDKEL